MAADLAAPLWIDRLDEFAASSGVGERPWGPVCWIVRHDEAAGWVLPPAEAADLADGAAARRESGGGRVLRRRLLRALAARVLGVHPAGVVFTRDARGAPGLAGSTAFVSTAGCRVDGQGWSAVALSPRRVGVDLEATVDADVRWTLTEAYLKGLGLGLDAAPEAVRIERDGPDGRWRLERADAPPARGEVAQRPTVHAALALWP